MIRFGLPTAGKPPVSNHLFEARYGAECRRVGRFMQYLMVVQWAAAILFACWISPYTWIGSQARVHAHIWFAVWIGGSLMLASTLAIRRAPTSPATRHLVAAIQMLWSALLIHLTGGRIETHFHVFASLAILSLYRDWKILVTSTIVVAIDHLIRGIWFPLSVFGVVMESPWRWLEHAAWVTFEIAFLIPGCMRLRQEIYMLCQMQVETEEARQNVEQKVEMRTRELREAKRFSDRVVESVSGIFYVLDSDGRFLKWNTALSGLLGLDREAMRQANLVDQVELLDRAAVAEGLEQCRRGQPFETVCRLQTPSGNPRSVLLNAQLLELGNQSLIVGSGQDITDRIASEQSLISFKKTLDQIHDCVFIFDPITLRFNYVNQGSQRQVGYTEAELLTMTPLDIKPEFTPERFQQLIQPLLERTESSLLFETVHRHKSGALIPVQISLQLAKLDDQISKFVAIGTDISDRRADELAKQKLQQQLVELSRKAGMAEVATGVLHNVGNLLNSLNISVNVIAESLDSKTGVADSLQRVSEMIQQHANSLSQFFETDPRGQRVPEFLVKLAGAGRTERQSLRAELDRIQQNVGQIKEIICAQQSMAKSAGLIQELDPRELIEQMLSGVSGSMSNHRIAVEVRMTAELPKLVSDRSKILQILVNLVTNAKDAVLSNPAEARQISIEGRLENAHLVFAVVDNGKGIQPEHLTKVFQYGFTTKPNGHGFGLHHSAATAMELGGTLTAASQGSGLGARFELSLPLVPVKRGKPKSDSQPARTEAAAILFTPTAQECNHALSSNC